jgi:hypothetical protein
MPQPLRVTDEQQRLVDAYLADRAWAGAGLPQVLNDTVDEDVEVGRRR